MKKKTLALVTAFAMTGILPSAYAEDSTKELVEHVHKMAVKYPTTKKVDVVDEYFGTKVSDPYRWLEDDRSKETADWVKAQNQVTFDYLAQIPYRHQIEERLTQLMDYEKLGRPFKEGKYTYFYKNDGLQNQDVLYRQLDDGKPEVFLDPNTFSEDGTTSLANVSFTKDGSLVAYSISEGGSDWRKVIVLDAETKKPVGETLVDIKFSGVNWLGNKGFYYSSYDKPEGSELSAKTDQHKLYYHELGTKQSEDKLIFGGTEEEKHRYVRGYTSDDQRYLFISASTSTSGNKLFFKDLTKPDSPLQTILDDTNSDTWVIDSKGTKLYLVTNLDAPNKRVVTVDAGNPEPKNWKDLIPETDNVLSPSTAGGYLFASYIVDALSMVKQYDMDGKFIREIKLPDIGSAYGFWGKKEDAEVYYSFTNYKTPSTTYRLDIKDGDSEVYHKSNAPFDPAQFESRQVFYKSKDGTKIPMIITYKKGTPMDGSAPTILYGYGGFNISLTPYFSPSRAAWLEMGGIYAVANIRGGGEYGKEWHNAGTKLEKQNSFDDFIAGAEFLIDKDYTSSEKLAINGGSNGGLLVGAVMTQRPELFKVALPAVGVLDMLRYHTFTAGAGWAYDYGTAEQSKEMFNYLKGYSPVHNVKAGVKYPATMVTTGDHDDRVVPAHSYKFAAELQSKQAGTNPTLIRIETNAGHGAGTPTSKVIEKTADVYSFTLFNMGVEKL
ncbi:prolyl oligopeptidase family serine peptidase [Vibrio harveyi]|uniref:prolyl oligopeptidase family serine peptidase n=1 Tax=Vibrio harveyi TaxID=669 RepID=UPI00211A1BC9|nr:prolyl oligopeptidase family serine peptidase [Vibrio harveyi]MCQ9082672.1 S9 family peptidase [Vibrio harveyi]CAK6715591.1 Prolyl endopeptidase [Vibrio harveyi]